MAKKEAVPEPAPAAPVAPAPVAPVVTEVVRREEAMVFVLPVDHREFREFCPRGVLGAILQGNERVRGLAVDLPHAYLHDVATDPRHCERGWDALVTRHMDEPSRRRILAAIERAADLVALLRTPAYAALPLVVLYSTPDDRCELLAPAAFAPAPAPARTRAQHGAPAGSARRSRRSTRADKL